MDRLRALLLAVFVFASTAAAAQQCGTLGTCPQASTPFSGNELMYVVQGGVSKQTTVGAIRQSSGSTPSTNVANVAALRLLPATVQPAVNVVGYYSATINSAPDGGGGIFINIGPGAPGDDDGGMTFYDSVSGTDWRRLTDTGELNVLWFGAISTLVDNPNAGTINCAQIPAAVSYAETHNYSSLYFPSGPVDASNNGGAYVLPCSLTITNNISIRGDGKQVYSSGQRGGTTLVFDGATNGINYQSTSASAAYQNGYIRDIELWKNSTGNTTSRHAITFSQGSFFQQGTIERVQFTGWSGYALYWVATPGATSATFTGSIATSGSNVTLTASSVTGTIQPGMIVYGTGVAAYASVNSYGANGTTGTGGAGTYDLKILANLPTQSMTDSTSSASFTGALISAAGTEGGAKLLVTVVASGTISAGDSITCTNCPVGMVIAGQDSTPAGVSGGVGIYSVNFAQTVSSEAMTAGNLQAPTFQNMHISNVSSSTIGGFIGSDPYVGEEVNVLTIENYNNENSVQFVAGEQPAFFNLLGFGLVNMKQIVVEGGFQITPVTIATGLNTYVKVRGLYIEAGIASAPTLNNVQVIASASTPPGYLELNNLAIQVPAVDSLIVFNGGASSSAVITQGGTVGSQTLQGVCDYANGTLNHCSVNYGGFGAGLVLDNSLISDNEFCNLTARGTPNTPPENLSYCQIQKSWINLTGQWLDGATGGPVTLTATNVNAEGMISDGASSYEGRVFEIQGTTGNLPTLIIDFGVNPPAPLVGKQFSIAVRYKIIPDTGETGLIVVPLAPYGSNPPTTAHYTGTLYQITSQLPTNSWNTAYFTGIMPASDGVHHIQVAAGLGGFSTPIGTYKPKLDIAAIWVAPGRYFPYIFGGSAGPISWRAAAAPTYGTYVVGDHVTNSAPAHSVPVGWDLTTAGSPGTWIPEANYP